VPIAQRLSFLISFTQYLFDGLHDWHLKILLVAAIIGHLAHIFFEGLQINHSVVAFGIIVTAEPRGDESRLTDFVMHELVTVDFRNVDCHLGLGRPGGCKGKDGYKATQTHFRGIRLSSQEIRTFAKRAIACTDSVNRLEDYVLVSIQRGQDGRHAYLGLSKNQRLTEFCRKIDAGGDGGRRPREHDYLERWCGGRALPWHRADLGFFGAHALSRCARVARMDSCDPLLATHFLLEKQVERRAASFDHLCRRGRVESGLVPMKTKTRFAFRVDIWDDTGDSIVEHVAGIDDFEVAEATYWAAVACWPAARITLRQGIRVVGRTRRVAEADSDLHRGSNRSELRPSLLSRLQPLWRGPKSKPYR